MLAGYRLPPESEAYVKQLLPHECFALLGWEPAQPAPGGEAINHTAINAVSSDNAMNHTVINAVSSNAANAHEAASATVVTAVNGELSRSVPGLVQCVIPCAEPSGTTFMLINLEEAHGPQLLEAVHQLADTLAGQEVELRLTLSRTFSSLGELAAVQQENNARLQQCRFFSGRSRPCLSSRNVQIRGLRCPSST
ncbi:hypothetical protein ACFTAO_17530 [Paenibacillus rhizoplanae]